MLWQTGGLDLLTLNNLYDEGTYRPTQQPVPYMDRQHHPFKSADPYHVPMTPHRPNPFGPYQTPLAAYAPRHPNLMMAPLDTFCIFGSAIVSVGLLALHDGGSGDSPMPQMYKIGSLSNSSRQIVACMFQNRWFKCKSWMQKK